ncbi:cytochrome b/b6 domain-containing protein [Stutzerimonas tarimensis]|uniref:Cytochrome b/b6 domain-containing protein n=1 Tax=Stutzerimonas tarimensis TaxID=1507735 RepID=A0ABV7T4U8_9GAMM
MADSIKVWDVPLRLFHWLLAVSVVVAIATGWIGGNWMFWHGRLGQFIFGLLVFRLVWGLVGSTYARWSRICTAPFSLLAYLRGEWRQPGHSPIGSLSVIAMLALLGFQAGSGLIATDDIAFQGPLYRLVERDTSALFSSLHRETKWWLIGLIGLHLAALLFYKLAQKRALVWAMVCGRAQRRDAGEREAVGGAWWAVVIAVAIALLAVWVVQSAAGWMAPPPAPPAPPALNW